MLVVAGGSILAHVLELRHSTHRTSAEMRQPVTRWVLTHFVLASFHFLVSVLDLLRHRI